MVGKKTGSRSISPKALSSGARPLKNLNAHLLYQTSPPSLHAFKVTRPCRRPCTHLSQQLPSLPCSRMRRAPHLTPPRKALLVYQKTRMMKKIPLQVLVTLVHQTTLRRRAKNTVSPWSLHATHPLLWNKMPSMHTSKAVLLWIRAHLVLPAKMPLMLIREKKTLPPYRPQVKSLASGNPLGSAPCGKNNFARFIGLEGNGVKLMLATGDILPSPHWEDADGATLKGAGGAKPVRKTLCGVMSSVLALLAAESLHSTEAVS